MLGRKAAKSFLEVWQHISIKREVIWKIGHFEGMLFHNAFDLISNVFFL